LIALSGGKDVKEIYILMMIHYRPCNSKWVQTHDRLHRCSLLSEQYVTSKPLLSNCEMHVSKWPWSLSIRNWDCHLITVFERNWV